ncbi:hypothetical protein BDV59DRAFT_196764 [Aspergillus ambiguus]|uniref:ankyrin repeat protein n=1 Tax=Aspergillus ambiguus TaxID=176160 RepID=UPI003CCCFA2D
MTQPNPYVLAADNPTAVLTLLRSNPAIASNQDEHGYSLLHAAASYGHTELLRALVREFHVDVNLLDEDGETCLFVTENVDIAKCLVEELGIDYNRKNEEGLTAQETIEADGSFPAVAAYLRQVMGLPELTESVESAADPLNPAPPLPPNIKVNLGTVSEQEANAGADQVDPEFKRRIDELAARDDFNSEATQSQLRELVMDAIRGSNIDTQDRENPFEAMGHSDSDHTNLSDPVVASDTSGSPDPPPYTATTTTTQESDITPEQSSQPDNKPIAIPAIGTSFDSPFLRAYAPILTNYNLPRESFFSFLDQLNKVISSSPPLQVLDATGGILRSVPILFPLRWLGSVVSGMANLGSQGVSKSRTDSYIRQANREMFGPRGLRVEIVKLDALAYMAEIPILDSHGKVNRQAPLFQQLLNGTGGAATDSTQDIDVQQRQVDLLQPWIAGLERDVLPWTSQSKLTRLNAALKKRNDGTSQQDESSDEGAELRQGLWLVIRPENA